MSAPTCRHAASGCDYPSGDCTGACMSEQGRESQRLIRATLAAAPKRYLTIVYEIHSAGQEQALLHAAAHEAVSYSHAIQQRDELLQALNEYREKAHRLVIQRDELREALQQFVDEFEGCYADGEPAMIKARAAIANAQTPTT